jgi:hypothetical protein
MGIQVKERALLTPVVWERPSDVLSKQTQTFWRVHEAFQGRSLEDITTEAAIATTNHLSESLGPTRALTSRVNTLKDKLIAGRPKKRKLKQQTAQVLSIR